MKIVSYCYEDYLTPEELEEVEKEIAQGKYIVVDGQLVEVEKNK